jgi:hypothetical protein
MTISPQGLSIQTLYRLYCDGSLVVNRQYQRKLVWTLPEKQNLIDSILKNYPLPLFLLAEKPPESSRTIYEIIDGMQRLNAIFSFIEQGFKWQDQCFDIREFARARQAKILNLEMDKYMRIIEDAISKSELDDSLKTHVLSAIDVVTYKGFSVVRLRVPRQSAPTFVGDQCYRRVGSSTKLATGPEIAAITKQFK